MQQSISYKKTAAQTIKPIKSLVFHKDMGFPGQIHGALPESRIELPPPLKWAGGKRWLAPTLKGIWKKYCSSFRLVEPFCGGLSVALALNPKKALLNDINKPLICFYKNLQKGLVVRKKFKNESEFYYEARSRFNHLLKKGEVKSDLAELFYYLNRTGYNGLCRFNNKGEFNVPFGSYKSINYKKNFLAYKKVFRAWLFHSNDFEDLPLNSKDFIYADPPYDVEFTKYSPQDFSFADQERLARFLSHHKGPVIISNQATSRIRKLYKKMGFQLKFLQAPRRISCTGDRSPAKEVLAFRNI